VLGTDLQGAPDAIDRFVCPAAVYQGVLLYVVAHLVDDLSGELDHMERIEHRDGLRELLADGVGVPVERVQGRCADPAREGRPLLGGPVTVGGSAAALHQVRQLSLGPAVLTRERSTIPK
jgi:hypothetical protein